MTPATRPRSLNSLTLAATVFCCVSGGPFGLEKTIGAAGPGLGLLLILVVPLVWALPDALTTAELASAIPEEGGYVIWVRRALGPFWSFVNAWWTWIYALVDATIYPVLFATYLLRLLGATGGDAFPVVRWTIAAAVIGLFTLLNIRGTRLVALASSSFAVVIVVPFLILTVVGLSRLMVHPMPIVTSFVPKGATIPRALADGLGIVMWNYLGWDALSTVAGEVERPEKAYPRAVLIGLPVVTFVYFLPVVASLPFVPDASRWAEGAWPEIASSVVGPWFATVIDIVGLFSASALFTASLLGSSRLPAVIAEAGFLPKPLVALHPRFGTPYWALLLCGGIYVLLALKSFTELVELNVSLYGAALFLEILSLLVLRRKEPELPRPFRIRGGWPVLVAVLLLPSGVIVAMTAVAVQQDGWHSQALDLTFLASGPVTYALVTYYRRWRRRWSRSDDGSV